MIDPFSKIKRRSEFPKVVAIKEDHPIMTVRPGLTNRAELPEAIVDAVANDPYTKGDSDISVTGLLRPPRLAALERIHADEIVEDAADRIWSLLGQAIHTILERANRVAIAERRLSIEMEGLKISGGMDVYEEYGILHDYKTTSVWKLIKGDLDEWEKQLNLYAVLLRHHGYQVEKLRVHAILRDWSKMEAQRDPTYPQAQVVSVNIKLWPPGIAEEFMRERIILHKQARISLPECTPEDRWARASVWAVMKAGRKTAVKLYSNENEARAHAGFDRTLSVVHRPGMSVRCQSYCPVSKFCEQYQKSLASSELPTEVANEVEQA
jgi:hypothetical protein